jgi:hypothetical protein
METDVKIREWRDREELAQRGVEWRLSSSWLLSSRLLSSPLFSTRQVPRDLVD